MASKSSSVRQLGLKIDCSQSKDDTRQNDIIQRHIESYCVDNKTNNHWLKKRSQRRYKKVITHLQTAPW